MTQIRGLSGEPIESEESKEKRMEQAVAQFEEMMKKLEDERIPLDVLESKAQQVQDIAARVGILSSLVKLTYSHPLTRTKGNETQGRAVEITGTVDMPLLDNQQIAILGLRLFDLAKKL